MVESTTTPVVVVLLRQPRNTPNEKRSDPFWEFGSFGITGCHQRNLMHPGKADELVGARLAFVQGGHLGFRLVHLTDAISVNVFSDRTEAIWNPVMPFCYTSAPVIVDSQGHSDIDGMVDIFKDVNRSGWPARFASKFRSRRKPLPPEVASNLVSVFEQRRLKAESDSSMIATMYEEALPVAPPLVDRDRQTTFEELRKVAEAA